MNRSNYVKTPRKKNRCEVRLSDTDVAMIEYLSTKTGKTTSDIIRQGIKSQFNIARYSG